MPSILTPPSLFSSTLRICASSASAALAARARSVVIVIARIMFSLSPVARECFLGPQAPQRDAARLGYERESTERRVRCPLDLLRDRRARRCAQALRFARRQRPDHRHVLARQRQQREHRAALEPALEPLIRRIAMRLLAAEIRHYGALAVIA